MSSVVGRLVFDYLAHEGMWKTAALLSRDVFGGSVTFTDEDVEVRYPRCQTAACAHALASPIALMTHILSIIAFSWPQSVKARHRVAAHIRAGQVDDAMALASRAVPNALEANSSVHFRLCCQKFVELVRI